MKCLVTVLFLLSTFLAKAQLNESTGHIWLKTGFGQADSANLQTYGISGEWLVHKNIGLNYNLELIDRNDKIWQLHSSAGLFVGPPLAVFGFIGLAAGKNDGTYNSTYGLVGLSALVGILVLALPDGVSGHFPIGHHFDLSPYVNFFGADIVVKNKLAYLRYASSFGVKTTFWNINGLTFTGYAETRRVSHMGWSYNGGVGVGYAFGNPAFKKPKPLRI